MDRSTTTGASPSGGSSPAGQEAIEDFLRYIERERRLSPHTVDAYRRDLSSFSAFMDHHIGTWTPDQVDRLDIRAWLRSLSREGRSDGTIRRRLSALRALYRFLYRTERSASNPARAVRTPKRSRPLPEWLTRTQISKMFDDMEAGASRLATPASPDVDARASNSGSGRPGNAERSIRNQAMVELFYSSGLRLSELHGLDRSDVDFDAGLVRVIGKGSKERIVPLGSKAARALEAYLDISGARDVTSDDGIRPLFTTTSGRRLSRRQIQRVVSRILATVSGAASMSTSTTRVYTHTSRERLLEAYRNAHPRAE
ncbi:MAG: site-specific integrase [Gemmatimonadota bacterium]